MNASETAEFRTMKVIAVIENLDDRYGLMMTLH